jgi:hypothetical protein
MPPTRENGPGPVTLGRPSSCQSAITVTSTTRRPVQRGRQRAASRRYAVTRRVSLLTPSGRRTCWWYLATCPVWRAPHLGRGRELADVTSTRRLLCGHCVTIAVARTYGRTDSGAAA